MKIFIVLFLFTSLLYAEKLATLIVTSADHASENVPTNIGLESLNFNADNGDLQLYELQSGEKTLVACQVENSHFPRLWWILDGKTPANSERAFELYQTEHSTASNAIQVQYSDSTLVIQHNNLPVLQYYMAEHKPPKEASSLFNRSAFIHPLWSPDGTALTRINPPDHWHHVGIWNPWTKTHFQGRDVDFWNIGDGQGTVQFANLLNTTEGPVYGGFQALQKHIDFTAPGKDRTAMHEIWDVRVWNCSDDFFVIDLYTTLSCATDSAIELAAYRYGGGLGFRANESWTKENVTVLTSEGKTRKNADGTKARWCDVSGEIANKRSGILFTGHPQNRRFPEPMRIWPLDANNGRGDMFFEFCPIRHESWHISPGKQYVLKYRMYVYDGEISPQQAEQLWQDFAHPPTVNIKRSAQ